MGRLSPIEWTDHTFNPWWGCEKVSPACAHCYAEAWARRVGQNVWGKDTERRFFSDEHWREPIRWGREAAQSGERRRVFCASMADVFEHRADLESSRKRLWALIGQTPSLDWLLLTKRPERIRKLVPWTTKLPRNVWIGTTAENQKFYEERVSHLMDVPAAVIFLSCEPLLGPIKLRRSDRVDWIIVGGESGAHARPMNPKWARDLRDQCDRRGMPFFFKQWGEWAPVTDTKAEQELIRVGKKAAGRMLDGTTWNGL